MFPWDKNKIKASENIHSLTVLKGNPCMTDCILGSRSLSESFSHILLYFPPHPLDVQRKGKNITPLLARVFFFLFFSSGSDSTYGEAKLLSPNIIISLVKMSQKPQVLRTAWGDRSQAYHSFAIPTSKQLVFWSNYCQSPTDQQLVISYFSKKLWLILHEQTFWQNKTGSSDWRN